MKCDELIKVLENEFPTSCAMAWDNVGLLVGSRDKEAAHIFVALDITEETIREAVKADADVIISHHPMIFSGIKQVTQDTVTGRKIIELIKQDISCIAMHTNFDVRGMAALNAKGFGLHDTQVLMITREDENGKPEGIGSVGLLEEPMTLAKTGEFVRKRLGVEAVRVYGNCPGEIRRLAVCGGSGKSAVPYALAAHAQVLVTGDIDYHTAIDAAADGLCIIDAGHYGTEMVFIPYMEKKLKELFPQLTVSSAAICQPFYIA